MGRVPRGCRGQPRASWPPREAAATRRTQHPVRRGRRPTRSRGAPPRTRTTPQAERHVRPRGSTRVAPSIRPLSTQLLTSSAIQARVVRGKYASAEAGPGGRPLEHGVVRAPRVDAVRRAPRGRGRPRGARNASALGGAFPRISRPVEANKGPPRRPPSPTRGAAGAAGDRVLVAADALEVRDAIVPTEDGHARRRHRTLEVGLQLADHGGASF